MLYCGFLDDVSSNIRMIDGAGESFNLFCLIIVNGIDNFVLLNLSLHVTWSSGGKLLILPLHNHILTLASL